MVCRAEASNEIVPETKRICQGDLVTNVCIQREGYVDPPQGIVCGTRDKLSGTR